MNKRNDLKEKFVFLQSKMISDANLSCAADHPTDKGANSEKNWIQWFKDYLPKRYKAAKATVIDSRGNTSDQIDIVLYDAQYSYLAFSQNEILYLPAESVYAVFEVKQDLSKAHMEYAGKKAESVRNLYRTSAAIPHAGGVYKPKPLHRILAGILTTNTKWAEPFGEPFQKCLMRYAEIQQIDCGCVLQGGAFYFDYVSQNLKKSNQEESLVYFFLQLLILLQNIGTVPAIDLAEYMKVLEVSDECLCTSALK